MASSLLFICIGATQSSRKACFPDPAAPLDQAGHRAAAQHSPPPRFHSGVQVSPARAARETAQAMNLIASPATALADIDHGLWTGLSFAAIAQSELSDWLADPAAGTPGGETLEQVRCRIGSWMDGLAASDTPTCAITHPMVVRAALAHALAMPLSTTLAIDLAPLSHVALSYNGKWRLKL